MATETSPHEPEEASFLLVGGKGTLRDLWGRLETAQASSCPAQRCRIRIPEAARARVLYRQVGRRV